MVKPVVTQEKRNVDINKWANDWVAFSKSVVPTVISFIRDLNLSSESSTVREVAGIAEQKPKSDFDLLFDLPPNKALTFDGRMMNKCLGDEVRMFQKLPRANSQPLDYLKNEHRFPLLKASAKNVLAIPVSSAAVERLFGAAGLLLSRLRKRMLPALVINSKCIRFACKMKIKGMVQELHGFTELFEAVDEQEMMICWMSRVTRK